MIGAIAMGIGLAVAQPVMTDDQYLGRFEGNWRGMLHYSQATLDLLEVELQRLGIELGNKNPVLGLPIFEFTMRVVAENRDLQITLRINDVRDPVEVIGVSNDLLSLVLLGAFRRPSMFVLEDPSVKKFIAPSDYRSIFHYSNRQRAIAWQDSKSHSLPVMGSNPMTVSDKREFVLELVGGKYLALHAHSLNPSKNLLFTIYFWRDEIG